MKAQCPHCKSENEGNAGELMRCVECGKPFEVGDDKARLLVAARKTQQSTGEVPTEMTMTESKIAHMVDERMKHHMKEESSSSGVFYLIIATLIAGIILLLGWVGNMSLIQRPDVALYIIAWGVVLQTSIAVAFDTKSILWLFGMLLLWAFALPYYAIKRTGTGGTISIIMLVIVFVFTFAHLSIAISEAADKVINTINSL